MIPPIYKGSKIYRTNSKMTLFNSVICALIAVLIINICICTVTADSAELRILGGSTAKERQFPYLVALKYSENGQQRKNCGGAILNNRWILTAAHCLNRECLYVVTGTTNHERGINYDIEKMIIHEDYNYDTHINDIGLIRVSQDILFSSKISPIKLDTRRLEGDIKVTIAGWGHSGLNTNQLQFVDLKTLTVEHCQRQMPWEVTVIDSQLCTLPYYNDFKIQGTCHGDSGGPLVHNGKVCGIVSLGFSKCEAGYPNIFTRVSSFVDWIQNRIQN